MFRQFHAMDTLHKSGYSIEAALSSLVPASGPVLCRDEMEEWSASEANLFEEALDKYGKDFADIRQDFVSVTYNNSITMSSNLPHLTYGKELLENVVQTVFCFICQKVNFFISILWSLLKSSTSTEMKWIFIYKLFILYSITQQEILN